MRLIRIDKFLKSSRIIRRRTVAKEACTQERVSINGKLAKPSDRVEVGDLLEVTFGSGTMKVEVLELKDTTKKKDAENMYKVL